MSNIKTERERFRTDVAPRLAAGFGPWLRPFQTTIALSKRFVFLDDGDRLIVLAGDQERLDDIGLALAFGLRLRRARLARQRDGERSAICGRQQSSHRFDHDRAVARRETRTGRWWRMSLIYAWATYENEEPPWPSIRHGGTASTNGAEL